MAVATRGLLTTKRTGCVPYPSFNFRARLRMYLDYHRHCRSMLRHFTSKGSPRVELGIHRSVKRFVS
jgi:hypothetical protein